MKLHSQWKINFTNFQKISPMFFTNDGIVSVAQPENTTQPYVFFFRDDSYQTGNKGSVTMNKKKPLSVPNPSILGRSNYTQLARWRRRIDRARFGRSYECRIKSTEDGIDISIYQRKKEREEIASILTPCYFDVNTWPSMPGIDGIFLNCASIFR